MNRTVTRNGHTWFVNNNEAKFWDGVENGDWEPLTFSVFDRFLDPAHSYIDVGAWIGPTVLYGAHLARHCYALEPDPVAFLRLRENVLLNPTLGERISLASDCLTSSCGPVHIGNKTAPLGGDSMSSLLFAGSAMTWPVSGLTIERFVDAHEIRDCSFLKIDIEGGEFELLPAMANYLRQYRPTVYLALHPGFLPDPEPGLAALWPVLSMYRHVLTPAMREVGPDILFDPELRGAFYELVLTDDDQ